MPHYVQIELTGYMTLLQDAGLAKREINRIFKQANYDMAVLWFDQFMAKHFTREGATEYGYASRSKEYEWRKARQKKHRRPLVWSGESERLAREGGSSAHVTSTSKYGLVRPRARKLNWKNANSDAHPSEEFKTISPTESAALARHFGASVIRQFGRLPKKIATISSDAAVTVS